MDGAGLAAAEEMESAAAKMTAAAGTAECRACMHNHSTTTDGFLCHTIVKEDKGVYQQKQGFVEVC